MSHVFELSRRVARCRLPALTALLVGLAALTACDNATSFSDSSTVPSIDGQTIDLADDTPIPEDGPIDTLAVSTDGASLSSASFGGGIPIGIIAQPTNLFGQRYNGALRNIWPQYLQSELAAIKSRGGKVVLMFAGNERYYKDASGHFDFNKWKARIDRFKNANFNSYVSDGTVIGHYLIDEPNDPANWNGRPVSPSTLDEMGRYSKQLWPGMATIVRVEPGYFTSDPRYIDAAWAQYLSRRGNASDYIRKVVSDAQNRGLGLVVGLNLIRGGTPNGTRMSAQEVENFGSALLSSSYPCAFISWQYSSDYLNDNGVGNAMDVLRRKAESRSLKSCRS